MAEAEGIWGEIRIDDSDIDKKLGKTQQRLEKTEREAKNASRGRGSLIAAGVAGAVAGAVGSAVAGSSPVQGILDLILNIVAAAILPIMVAMLPLVEAAVPALIEISTAIAPTVQKIAEAGAFLIELASGDETLAKKYGGVLDQGSLGTDVARLAFNNVLTLGAVAEGALDPNRSIKQNVSEFYAGQKESLEDITDYGTEFWSSAWDSTQEWFGGIGGQFG